MEQHVSTLLIRHHYSEHILFNTQKGIYKIHFSLDLITQFYKTIFSFFRYKYGLKTIAKITVKDGLYLKWCRQWKCRRCSLLFRLLYRLWFWSLTVKGMFLYSSWSQTSSYARYRYYWSQKISEHVTPLYSSILSCADCYCMYTNVLIWQIPFRCVIISCVFVYAV
jgi:hypothetical protein